MSITRFKECLRDGFSNPDLASKLYKNGDSTTIQNADPWSGAQPYIYDYMYRARDMNKNNPGQYYPGSMVTPFSRQSRSGMRMMSGFSKNPRSLTNQSANQFLDTVHGDYLPGGEQFNAITDPAKQSIMSQFAGAGRYGSGMNQQSVAKGIMEAAQPYWDAERGRMMTASAAGPSAEMARVSPLMQIGNMLEGKQDQRNQDAFSRWNYYQNEPWERLQRYASLVSPGAGFGSTTSTQMPGGSPVAGALGGGMMGGMAGSAIGNSILGTGFSPLAFMGPYGGIIGAGLGALAGGFL